MDEQKIEKILRNAKTSMEVEGFTIDRELEETGRKILAGEINVSEYISAYIARYKENAARQSI